MLATRPPLLPQPRSGLSRLPVSPLYTSLLEFTRNNFLELMGNELFPHLPTSRLGLGSSTIPLLYPSPAFLYHLASTWLLSLQHSRSRIFEGGRYRGEDKKRKGNSTEVALACSVSIVQQILCAFSHSEDCLVDWSPASPGDPLR